MTIQKINFPELTTSSAFVVADLADAHRATGVVRSAKKILQDGAKLLARSQTYSWAVLQQQISGASAGINTQGDERSAAIAGFCEQILSRVANGELSLDAAKGVSTSELSTLIEADPLLTRRHADFEGTALGDALLAAGVTAAAAVAIGGLDGRSFVIEGAGDATIALIRELVGQGGRVVAVVPPTAGSGGSAGVIELPASVDDAIALLSDPSASGSTTGPGDILAVDADVLICGSKSGFIDHESAATLAQKAVVPVGSTPITARGLAVARRRGIKVLADFVTTAGPMFAEIDPTGEPAALIGAARERIDANCREFAEHPDGDLLAACYKAEEFLGTWRDELPFGRPIA
ncbi:MAG: hypothetical protein WBF71_03175 [Microthrixaceae bacterium]